ncbi:uncharacterized protein [Musca autumnalis]|uniref:uncharacterized protein n=1 Tax=Musca autumnalis TaxID=221902 RepID=UPI003CF7EE37
MGKHINQQQEDLLINFMEKHPNLAKGFAKGDRTEIENLWQTLAENLNSVGPPIKETEAWKKAWIDKKSIIKRKLAANKKEVRATGGGPYNQMYISSKDEAIARLCGLYHVVDGIGNSVACGSQSVEPEEERPATSSDSSDTENVVDELPSTSANARKRKSKPSDCYQSAVKKFMSEETASKSKLTEILSKLQTTMEETKEVQKNVESNTKRMYRAFDKINENINEQTKELKRQGAEQLRHNKAMEKYLYEKNLLKKELLELQKQQYDLYKS